MTESSEEDLPFDPSKSLPTNEVEWGKTISTYEDVLRRHAISIVGDQNVAEDMVQGVFLKIIEGKVKTDGSGIKNLLITIVRRDSIRYMRRRTATSVDLSDTAGTDRVDPSSIKEKREQVLRCLEKLKLSQREIIILHYFVEWSLEYCAELLNEANSTLSARHVVAKDRLQECLERNYMKDVERFRTI